jgi:hypothetical protein
VTKATGDFSVLHPTRPHAAQRILGTVDGDNEEIALRGELDDRFCGDIAECVASVRLLDAVLTDKCNGIIRKLSFSHNLCIAGVSRSV